MRPGSDDLTMADASLTTIAPSHFPLLSLPSEIKDKIYRYVLRSERSFEYDFRETNWMGEWKKRRHGCPLSAQLLRTSREVYDHAIFIFFENLRFTSWKCSQSPYASLIHSLHMRPPCHYGSDEQSATVAVWVLLGERALAKLPALRIITFTLSYGPAIQPSKDNHRKRILMHFGQTLRPKAVESNCDNEDDCSRDTNVVRYRGEHPKRIAKRDGHLLRFALQRNSNLQIAIDLTHTIDYSNQGAGRKYKLSSEYQVRNCLFPVETQG
jgi:hypothetical protein